MDGSRTHDTFLLRDGTPLHTLTDLYGALSTMTDGEFAHHADGHKNDFAAWVERSDKHLAQAMRQAGSREEMRKAIFIALFR